MNHNGKKEFCLRGHKLSGKNLHVNKVGARVCKTCNSMRTLQWLAREKKRKEEAAELHE